MRCSQLEERGAVGLLLFSGDALGLCLSSGELFSLNALGPGVELPLVSLDALLLSEARSRWASAFQRRCAGLCLSGASCSASMRSASGVELPLVQPRCAVAPA